MPVRNSALLIQVAKSDTANAGFSADNASANNVESYALAMDKALGLEKPSLFVVSSRWNAHAIEFAWSLAPMVCDIFSLAVKACVELQLSWLSWLPGWHLGTPQPEANGQAASETEEQWSSRLASSMDVAIGAPPVQPDSAALPFEAVFNPAALAATALEHPAKPVQRAEAPASAAMKAGA